MHGKTSLIHHDGKGIYRGMPNPFEATRYHSLVIKPGTLSDDFDIVAVPTRVRSWAVVINAFRSKGSISSESFLTGIDLLRNFIGR